MSVLSSHAQLSQEWEIIEEFPRPSKSQGEMLHLEGIGTKQKHQQLQMEERDLADGIQAS